MEKKPSGKANPTRPKDRSFEAYKAWVQDLVKRYTTQKYEVNWTQKEWIESWKEYWEEKSSK